MTDIDIVDALRGFGSDIDDPHALMRDAAAEIESLRNQVDSMQLANDMLRATHRTDNQYLLDEIERLRGEVEWEYAPASGLHAPTTDRYELDCAPSGVVRRRKAGEWEPIPGGGNA